MSYAGKALSGAGLYFVIAIVVVYLCFCLWIGGRYGEGAGRGISDYNGTE